MRRWLVNWWTGVAVAFVLLIPHVRMYSAEATRYYTFWDRTDAVAVALLLVAIGGLFAGAEALAVATGVSVLRRFTHAAFVVVLGLGAVAALRTGRVGSGMTWWLPATTALACAVGLIGLLSVHPRMHALPRAARALCLVLSPAVPIVLVQLLAYPEFSIRRETLAPHQHGRPIPTALTGVTPGNVYLFIFDEWSLARTFTPDMAEQLPNLARFIESATVYHDAHAPFNATRLSLPGILFQTDDEFTWAGGVLEFRNATGGLRAVKSRSNVFSLMKTLGFSTCLGGFSHPYRRMFGPELNYCFAAPDGRGNDDARLGGDDLLRHLRLAGALLAMALPKPAALEWRTNDWCVRDDLGPRVARVAEVHAQALRIVRQPAPTFAVLHYPLPHDPFLFDRDGVHLELTRTLPLNFGPYGRGGFVRPNPENHIARYAANLRYLDTLFGELLDAMRSSGNLDDATIILTSDHTWRFDPALDDLYIERGLPYRSLTFDPIPPELTHVPLIVRQPRQSQRTDVMDSVELIRLMEMLGFAERRPGLAGQ